MRVMVGDAGESVYGEQAAQWATTRLYTRRCFV